MGKKENPLLVYYNQPERFAQLLNGWLFRGMSFLEAGDINMLSYIHQKKQSAGSI